MGKPIFTQVMQVLAQKRNQNRNCEPDEINRFTFRADSEEEAETIKYVIAFAHKINFIRRMVDDDTTDRVSPHELARYLQHDNAFRYDPVTRTASFEMPPGYLIPDLEKYAQLLQQMCLKNGIDYTFKPSDLSGNAYVGKYRLIPVQKMAIHNDPDDIARGGPEHIIEPLLFEDSVGLLTRLLRHHGLPGAANGVENGNDILESITGRPLEPVSFLLCNSRDFSQLQAAERGPARPPPPR